MKKMKQPFAESAYSKMMRGMTEYELEYKKYENLLMLRDRIEKGSMTRDLYDFINADGSLENMLVGLPPPVDGVACESLRMEQLRMINQIIATEEFNLKNALKAIWELISEAWLDWWDRSRRIRFLAIDLKEKFETNPTAYFGDRIVYSSTQVLMYHHDNWEKMCAAARELVNEVRTKLPTSIDQVKPWITSAKPNLSRNLAEFGMYINENGTICRGTIKHIRQENSCATLGWRYDNVVNELKSVIDLIGDEIQARRDYNRIKSTFNPKDGVVTRAELMFIKDVVMASKQTAYNVGRTYCVMLNTIIRKHMSNYRLTKIQSN